ncbi:dsDNA nuclease domain-containing protein [Paludisphaera rhizosphaerae]|uniref:dsDNA nuclease domain-containing protein n=1 Tax=Paludisphaera rhizosphaerae TaxID=2711216 RepID=UPI0013EB7D2D|nr:dsDNA nuclease domain-containing protein [Paludisphaera rhizosphaerae]
MAHETPEPAPRRRGPCKKKPGPSSESPQPKTPPTIAAGPTDPTAVHDASDPGDAVLQCFRYQLAYGVILLAMARRGLLPYVALWCEHHEDFLAHRDDGKFDAYQIKTSRPENGAWKMSDLEMVKSIGRFVDLVAEFGDRIGTLYFVSNTDYDHCTDDYRVARRRRRRPVSFLRHVCSCESHEEIAAPYDETFLELQGQCACQPEQLFVVLKRMDLRLGPPRISYQADVAHEHIGRLSDCSMLAPARLDEYLEDLIGVVFRASSLVSTDPMRHVRSLVHGADIDPILAAKRLSVAEVMVYRPRTPQANGFRFPGPPTIQLGAPSRSGILREKLERGHLGEQFDYLRGRELAAEYNQLEDVHRSPEQAQRELKQLEEVVLGECSEAHLRARLDGEPFGPRMMVAVQDRLRRLADSEPARVCHKPYDYLLGMVSALTGDTRVWWSPRFPIQEPAA